MSIIVNNKYHSENITVLSVKVRQYISTFGYLRRKCFYSDRNRSSIP